MNSSLTKSTSGRSKGADEGHGFATPGPLASPSRKAGAKRLACYSLRGQNAGHLRGDDSAIERSYAVNKRKKVAIHKHRVKAKKMEEKRRTGAVARRG